MSVMIMMPHQLRNEHLRSTQLQQERIEKELRNKEAQALKQEIAIQKKREKESILDELVIHDCATKCEPYNNNCTVVVTF